MSHNTTRQMALRILIAYAMMITFAVIALGAETLRLGSLTDRVTRNQTSIQQNEVRITKTGFTQCQRVQHLRDDTNYNAALLRVHILVDAQQKTIRAARLTGSQRRRVLATAAAERQNGDRILYQPPTNCGLAIRLDGSYVPPKPIRFTARRTRIILATGP